MGEGNGGDGPTSGSEVRRRQMAGPLELVLAEARQLDRAPEVRVHHLALFEGDGAVRVVVADGCRDEECPRQLGIDDHLGAQDGFFRVNIRIQKSFSGHGLGRG